jgi:hypothetical protein
MCQYFSCVVTKDLQVFWDKSIISHSELEAKHQLKDVSLSRRQFIRFEITPISKEKITRSREDWALRVDEEGSLPKWFKDTQKQCEELAWTAWSESVKVNLAIGEESVEVRDQFLLCAGKAKVVGHDSTTMEGYGSTTMVGYG